MRARHAVSEARTHCLPDVRRYAGISAHAGVVLLAGTMPMWFQFEWARALLAATGALTIVQAACNHL